MSSSGRGRGRPPKTDETDINAIKAKIEEEELKFGARCADNLTKLYDVVFSVAFNDKVSIKDQVGSAKYCIEKAEKFVDKANELSEEEKEGVEVKNSERTTGAVISLKSI